MRQINRIIVHCSDSEWGDAAIIDQWHKQRGFAQIGYHAVICNGMPETVKQYLPEYNGRIEPGRPITHIGAHAKGANRDSLGICLIGVASFTQPQWRSLLELINVWSQLYSIEPDNIIGHRDLPGAAGKTCPNFDVQSFLMVAP